MTTEIITLKEARERGLSRYFTGKPCIRGHVSERRTSDRCCCRCGFEKVKAYQKTETGRQVKNRQKRIARSTPEMKLKGSLRNAQWVKNNPGKARAKTARRRALRLQRTPVWANLDKIRRIYENCPPGMVVDHVVPLAGKLVSGLHVHTNLQYLSQSDNDSKGNKWDPWADY